MNVQQVIIKGIKEQLFYHDYLVLPDFGGFVLKSNATHFSGSALIQPPSKTISFNVQLRQNDGILVVWLQDQLQCSASESLMHLREFGEFCNNVLIAKRRLTLENIGFFYLDFENNLCFEPQQDTNFLTSSFGLAPVSVKTLDVEGRTEIKKDAFFTDRKIISSGIAETAVKKTSNYRKVIAPAAFLILFFGLLLIFVSNSRINGQLKASAFGSYDGIVYQSINYPELHLLFPEQKTVAYVADANGIAIFELNDKKSIAVKAVENFVNINKTKQFTPGVTRSDISRNYEIVLGCFGVLDNARRMAAKLSKQNIEVVISERNAKGLYTVSNGSFESKGEALVKLEELKSGFPGAWIKNP